MKKKKFTRFTPKIRSRHPSHDGLRKALPMMPFTSVIRFGSTTEIRESLQPRVEVNCKNGIRNSSNKRLMKHCFHKAKVQTALWYVYTNGQLVNQLDESVVTASNLPFPIIAKRHFGSKGKGNTKLNNLEEYKAYVATNPLNNTIFEKFYNFNREYRLHVSEDGCFYACRKLMRRDTPDGQKWFKNDSNCVWALEENADFDRPTNWKDVIKECVKALKSLDLDFAAMDLRIQSATDSDGNRRDYPAFIVIEANSAPGLGGVGLEKYKEELPKILLRKYNNG